MSEKRMAEEVKRLGALIAELQAKLAQATEGNGVLPQSPDACCKAIEDALRSYRCMYTREGDEHGESGLPLVDMLTPPQDGSIKRGEEELALLAEHLFDELPPFTAPAVHSQVNADVSKVTRVEIIDHLTGAGRAYVFGPIAHAAVELSVQDEGRTLKVFIDKREGNVERNSEADRG